MSTEVVETVEVVAKNSGIMGQAGQITLVGIALLFLSLFILWAVMEILVRVVKDPAEDGADKAEAEAAPAIVVGEEDLKMRAAAAAVASIQNYDVKMKAAAAAAGFVFSKRK